MSDIYERIEAIRSSMSRLLPQLYRRPPARKAGLQVSMSMSEVRLMHLFKEKQVCKMSEVAGFVGIPLPTATHIVDKLVKQELLKRKLNAGDRRVVLIEITGKGRKAMEVCDKQHRADMKRFIDMLPAEDKNNVMRVINDFAEVMEVIAKKMEKRAIKLLLILLLSAGTAGSSYAKVIKVLSFDAYLSQVKEKNPELKSTALSIDALGKKISQSEMAYFPRFIGNYTYIDDKSGAGFGSTLPLKENNTYAWDLGLSKKWETGTVTSLGFSNSISALDLSAPYTLFPGLTLSNFTAYSTAAFLKVEQSLVRELAGGFTEAGINKAKAGIRSAQYMKQYSAQQLLLRTRFTYLSLSLARDVVNFRKQELKRAEDILQWNEDRVNNDLADRGDLLQAKGFLGLRKLNLQMAVEDERKTCRAFNELRGTQGSLVSENITGLDEITAYYSKFEVLKAGGKRADVLSASSLLESAAFAKTETSYSLMPDVSVFGKVSLSGLDLTNDGAFSQVTNASKPIYLFGINLNLPLDFGSTELINKGYDLDVESAKESLNKAELSANKDWLNLTENWKNVKSRLETALSIKRIQTERLEYSRERFVKGRLTMAQLVITENDLDDATLNYYRFIIEQVATYYEAEIYNTKPIE